MSTWVWNIQCRILKAGKYFNARITWVIIGAVIISFILNNENISHHKLFRYIYITYGKFIVHNWQSIIKKHVLKIEWCPFVMYSKRNLRYRIHGFYSQRPGGILIQRCLYARLFEVSVNFFLISSLILLCSFFIGHLRWSKVNFIQRTWYIAILIQFDLPCTIFEI